MISTATPLQHLETHILRLVCEVETPLRLHIHKGSALRGAWAGTLMSRVCPQPWVCRDNGCAMPHGCPISALVGPANEGSERGRDVPRPYIFEPPLDSRTDYAPGDKLEWQMILFGNSIDWFPYVVMSVKVMGDRGIGLPAAPSGGKGRFRLREIWATNPLSGVQQRLFAAGESQVLTPGLPVTHETVCLAASRLPADNISLRFKTPLRLAQDHRETDGERKLTHELPPFHTLISRLDDRLRDLTTYYGGWGPGIGDRGYERSGGVRGEPQVASIGEWPRLDMETARQVTAQGHMEWLEVQRYSSRQERRLPMGGLRGRVTYRGEIASFLPLLVWGQFCHVGKYAVMGNGGYEIEA